jgi:ABC-2 type transport system ATP-binding protein
VDEVLETVGLAGAANRRVKGYSMGMRQRLAIAAALLGDPEVLILDEPVNGLDPPGIRWIRDLLRSEAGRGRAVLVSSHLLSEVAQSVDDVVVISHGVLRAGGPLASVLGSPEGELTRVRAADPGRLAGLLRDEGAAVERDESGALLVRAPPEVVGTVAAAHRVVLTELVVVSRSLEEAFFALTGEEG